MNIVFSFLKHVVTDVKLPLLLSPAIEAGGSLNARFQEFLQLPAVALPRHLLNEQLSWRLRCSASVRSASRELAQSFLPAPFLGLPLGVSTDVGPCP